MTVFQALRFQRRQQSKMLIGQMDEFFRNLLFEIESWIKPLQGIDRTLKCFRPRLGGARRRFALLSVLGRGCFAELLHLLAKTRQQFHVALSTLNFLVEYYAVEQYMSFGQL